MGKKFVMMSLSRLQNLYYFQDKVDILHPTRANQEYQLSQVHFNKKVAFQLGLRCIQLKFFDLLQWIYLIYHEKCKASFKNINITKSLRCKLKVAGVYFHQKIVFLGSLLYLVFLRSYIFFINNFYVIVNVVVKTEESRTIFKEISGN